MKKTKFVVFGDLHGDIHHPASVKVLRSFIQDFKPKLRVCIGDIWDFRPLRKGCSQDEASEGLRQDVQSGKQLVDLFKPTHVTLGNHDQRLWDEAEHGRGLVQEYCQRGVDDLTSLFKKHNTTWVPYSVFEGIEIGNAYFCHGFRANLHAAKATAEDFSKPGRHIFFGHTHSVSRYKSVSGTTAYNIGCMCELNMEYNQRRPNSLRWQNGFAAGEIHDDGTVVCWVFTPDGNKWNCVTEVKQYVA